jgi:His-Xaa-Ser system radical SAM maturase HxsC
MLLRVKGNPKNINTPIIGKVTRNPDLLDSNTFFISEDSKISFNLNKCVGVLSNTIIDNDFDLPSVENVPTFEDLAEGDIIVANPDGNINTLYRVNANHNTLFVTERCNSNCLMCSQPPKNKDDISRLNNINRKLIPLIPKDCHELGISGGEPTLMGEHFFETLEALKVNLPDTEIHVLSNGRSFSRIAMAERLGKIEYSRLMIGIPLYSDFYQSHDYIVQAKDAFNQTVIGIHNLARFNQRIEIRVVLHKLSIPRLTKLARYIYKNFPFVEHVTFMGLEYVGYTPYNIDKLWIDPSDYINELEEAVEFLAGQGMRVSIYNSQLCVLPENLWEFSRKSISDWKNSYLPECSKCSKLEQCGGLFTWNLKKHSTRIKAFN